MNESEFYQKKIKPILLKRKVAFCRVEASGIPDVYVSRNNIVLWIELKCVNTRSKIIKPDWRLGQLSWIKRQNLFGSDNVYLGLMYINKTYFLTPKKTYLESELQCKQKDFFSRLGL